MKGGRKFALKVVHKEKLSDDQQRAVGSELAIMRRLRHHGLLQLVDELDTPAEWYFILELFNVRILSVRSLVVVAVSASKKFQRSIRPNLQRADWLFKPALALQFGPG